MKQNIAYLKGRVVLGVFLQVIMVTGSILSIFTINPMQKSKDNVCKGDGGCIQ